RVGGRQPEGAGEPPRDFEVAARAGLVQGGVVAGACVGGRQPEGAREPPDGLQAAEHAGAPEVERPGERRRGGPAGGEGQGPGPRAADEPQEGAARRGGGGEDGEEEFGREAVRGAGQAGLSPSWRRSRSRGRKRGPDPGRPGSRGPPRGPP